MSKQEQITQLREQLAQLEQETFEENNASLIEPDDGIEDAEIITDTPSENNEDIEMQTVIYLGKTKAGGTLFKIEGDSDLLIVDGLLDYAKREIDAIYEEYRESSRAEKEQEEKN